MPGMIDAHVHINTGGATETQRTLIALANAQIDLAAGFTTGLDMDSRGGYNTVTIRDRSFRAGSGPASPSGGESLNPRRTNYYPDIRTGRFRKASSKIRTSTVRGSPARQCGKPSCTAWTG